MSEISRYFYNISEVLLANGLLPHSPIRDRIPHHDDLGNITSFPLGPDSKGNTILHHVSSYTTHRLSAQVLKDAMNMLLGYGTIQYINYQNSASQTPLMLSMKQRTPGITRALLRAGADVHIANYQGKTPLFFAKTVSHAQALLSAGADKGATDKWGKNPLAYALERGDEPMVSLLLDDDVDSDDNQDNQVYDRQVQQPLANAVSDDEDGYEAAANRYKDDYYEDDGGHWSSGDGDDADGDGFDDDSDSSGYIYNNHNADTQTYDITPIHVPIPAPAPILPRPCAAMTQTGTCTVPNCVDEHELCARHTNDFNSCSRDRHACYKVHLEYTPYIALSDCPICLDTLEHDNW